MSKHTPGPWAPDYAEHDCPHQDVKIKAGKRGVCRVWMDNAPVEDYNREQRANARLIAAAPELLEALEGLLAKFEDLEELCASEFGAGQVTAEETAAKAVIAKVKGEQL